MGLLEDAEDCFFVLMRREKEEEKKILVFISLLKKGVGLAVRFDWCERKSLFFLSFFLLLTFAMLRKKIIETLRLDERFYDACKRGDLELVRTAFD